MAKYTITLDKLLDRTDRGNVLQAIGMIRGVEDIDGVPLPEESPTKSPNNERVSVLKYVEDRLAILKGHDIIKNKVDWYYACQLCDDIIQYLNAETGTSPVS